MNFAATHVIAVRSVYVLDPNDGILAVNRSDFISCNLSQPICGVRPSDAGKIENVLTNQGYRYMTSALVSNCERGQKFAILVANNGAIPVLSTSASANYKTIPKAKPPSSTSSSSSFT
ncbi:hypothetical protein TIFTF001_027361 [Ficus carica]|uniref:Uncharacterized protein n=1 Tax=Ficus carica TaxID=3494 RepID=A0AA88DN32_FICCA|nr:hypothetical protein TIFTF001_027361 [Ficus carica]